MLYTFCKGFDIFYDRNYKMHILNLWVGLYFNKRNNQKVSTGFFISFLKYFSYFHKYAD